MGGWAHATRRDWFEACCFGGCRYVVAGFRCSVVRRAPFSVLHFCVLSGVVWWCVCRAMLRRAVSVPGFSASCVV